MIKNLKFRLYPTKRQAAQLSNCLEESRYVYNLLLDKRQNAWKNDKKILSAFDQMKDLPRIKLDRPSVKLVHSQCLQNIAVRIDIAYQLFFRRFKKDPKSAGLPRFKSERRYNSITFPQYGNGCKIDQKKLRVSKIGDIYIELHRDITNIKTITIKREPTGKWFAIISCEAEVKLKTSKSKSVGIDLGITTFATLSNKKTIENPRFFDKGLKNIGKLSRRIESNPSKKNKHSLVLAHEKIKNKRDDFHHKESAKLVSDYSKIFVEDLDVSKMIEKHWVSRQIADVGWYNFILKCEYKAEEAGVVFKKVNPAYTSQDCSKCGYRVFKKLSTRTHHCSECGLKIDRDLNAAINIQTRGLASLE